MVCGQVDEGDVDLDERTDDVLHPPDVGPWPGWSQELSALLWGT